MRFAALIVAALVALIQPAYPQGGSFNEWCLSPYATVGSDAYRPCQKAATITGNAAGTTGAVTGTLAAAAGKITYICGFAVSSVGGTAATGPITVAGLVGGSMVFQFNSAAAAVNLVVPLHPCIPASAVNTAITVATTANGTATAVNVNSWGYQQ